jgi:two-component system sensor histidine kinase KdpD
MVAFAAVAIETTICWFTLGHRLPDVVMVYLLGIVLLAVRHGYSASLPATVLSVAGVEFFFTRPYLSFHVSDRRLLLTCLLMAFVASVISSQTERIRRRQERTEALYAMSRELTLASSAVELAAVACRNIRDVFSAEAWVLIPDTAGVLQPLGSSGSSPLAALLAKATELMASHVQARPGDRAGATDDGRVIPLRASTGVQGVLVIQALARDGLRGAASRDLLDLFVSHIATALERARLGDESQRAQLEIKTERLRNALLSSVSHDLRTPLTVIKGTVTALIEGGSDMSPARQRENLETISTEASRLNRLFRNLLDITSLEAGTVRVRKEWQLLEEVIGVALDRLEEQLEERKVEIRIEPEAALAPLDATLIEQVLINLIENATKYTAPSSPIEITTRRSENEVAVSVSDCGPGVPEGELEAIFEKFHRATQSATGMGLGLTICRGIVSAHGGQIACMNRDGGGATFEFTLPLQGEPPPMDGLPEAAEL